MKNIAYLKKTTLILLAAGALLLTGCASSGNTEEKGSANNGKESEAPTTAPLKKEEAFSDSQEEQDAMRAMYLTDPSGNIYFVDTRTGTFFTAPIPDTLYDSEGNMLSSNTLRAGYILDIYGNGIMLESYPGQYPGVTKMIVIEEGSETDAEQYQYLIDEIYTEPDYSEPASLSLEYRTELAVTTVMLTRGNYEWNYMDEHGENQSVIACGSHILQWPELMDVTVEEKTPLTLTGSYLPESVTVTRWPVHMWNADDSAENIPEGEAIAVTEKDEGFVISDSEPGYVYLIEAKWEEGFVEFGFYTK